MKPLICIPSPRDIPEFFEAAAFLPADKFWIKYHREADAYSKIRRFFLERSEYTHMVLLPDDLIVRAEDFTKLMGTAAVYKFDVISGICNVEYSTKHLFNICDNLPSLELADRL